LGGRQGGSPPETDSEGNVNGTPRDLIEARWPEVLRQRAFRQALIYIRGRDAQLHFACYLKFQIFARSGSALLYMYHMH
jgi:hypothetical protein